MQTQPEPSSPSPDPTTVLVVDRSSAAATGIVDRLDRAGHRIVFVGSNHLELDDLLESRADQNRSFPRCMEFDAIAVEPDQRMVRVRGTTVALSRLEFDLLHALIESPRRVLTHGELAERVWNDHFVSRKTITVLASRLRRRIIDAGGPRVAQAVHGVGYRLACAA